MLYFIYGFFFVAIVFWFVGDYIVYKAEAGDSNFVWWKRGHLLKLSSVGICFVLAVFISSF